MRIGMKQGLAGLASAFTLSLGLAITPAGQALAQTAPTDTERTTHREQVLKYANGNFLAYVPSVNTQANNDTVNGLRVLQEALTERTSLDPNSELVGLDLANDTLIPFKFIYWPIAVEDTTTITPQAQQKVQTFIDQGGVIMFDVIGNNGSSLEDRIGQVIGSVNLGIMSTYDKDHPLNITYYNIQGFPQRYRENGLTGGFNSREILLQRPDDRKAESISSVIIGDQREWARALSGRGVTADAKEYAIKSIINVVLSAYTGNYKLDQGQIMQTLQRVLD